MRGFSIAVVLLLASAANGQERVWKDVSGAFQTKATFVDSKSNAVTLKTSDGNVIDVPLSKLSENDRRLATALSGLLELQRIKKEREGESFDETRWKARHDRASAAEASVEAVLPRLATEDLMFYVVALREALQANTIEEDNSLLRRALIQAQDADLITSCSLNTKWSIRREAHNAALQMTGAKAAAVAPIVEHELQQLLENTTRLQQSLKEYPESPASLAVFIAKAKPDRKPEMVGLLTEWYLNQCRTHTSLAAGEATLSAALGDLVPEKIQQIRERGSRERGTETASAIRQREESARMTTQAAAQAETQRIEQAVADFNAVVDFPEDYLNKTVLLKFVSIEDKANWVRNREAELYVVGVSSKINGKKASLNGTLDKNCLNFVLYDKWGRDLTVNYLKPFGVDILCHIYKRQIGEQEYFVARIYRFGYFEDSDNIGERLKSAAFGGEGEFAEQLQMLKANHRREVRDESFSEPTK